jgi:hypothetical protein
MILKIEVVLKFFIIKKVINQILYVYIKNFKFMKQLLKNMIYQYPLDDDLQQ